MILILDTDTFITNPELFYEKSELLKALAHPVRLCIVRGLMAQGDSNVSYIQSCLGMPQSTISQHLAKLRLSGIIEGRRQGLEVYYSVVNEDVRKIIRSLFN
jgi:ArsR family transcriptional regulator